MMVLRWSMWHDGRLIYELISRDGACEKHVHVVNEKARRQGKSLSSIARYTFISGNFMHDHVGAQETYVYDSRC